VKDYITGTVICASRGGWYVSIQALRITHEVQGTHADALFAAKCILTGAGYNKFKPSIGVNGRTPFEAWRPHTFELEGAL